MSVQTIKKHLSNLSRAEQAEIMHFMVELLAKDDFHLSEEWKTELNRREQALEDGTSVGRPAKSVLAKYRR